MPRATRSRPDTQSARSSRSTRSASSQPYPSRNATRSPPPVRIGRETSPVGRKPDWGRLLVCGGTDWESNANPPVKKIAKLTEADHVVPVKPRWISHLSITKVIGGATANYTIAIDRAGTAHIFGRIPYFGVKDPRQKWNVVSCDEPLHVPPPPGGGKWDGGAVGASHFILFSGSAAYGAGDNRANALGVSGRDSTADLIHIPGPWEAEPDVTIAQIAVGSAFSVFLDSRGRVYTAGLGQYGQLGNGTTGEVLLRSGKVGYAYGAPPQLVQSLADIEIVAIACGDEHAMALDDGGNVWVWGRNLVASLGLGDREDRLVPTKVEQFDQLDVVSIYAGPASSVLITDPHDESEGRRMWIAGKCKIKGPGSGNEPFEKFQLVDLANVAHASVGYISHFASIFDDDEYDTRVYAWGEGATHGELGIGKEFLSSSDPEPIAALDGLEVLAIAAGLVHTVFLVSPNQTLEERVGLDSKERRAIARWPPIETGDYCLICEEGDDPDNPDKKFLECERCEEGYHNDCVQLDDLPEGEWFCPPCEQSAYQWSHPSREGFAHALPGALAAAATNSLQGPRRVGATV